MKKSPIDSKIAGQRNERMILSMLRNHGELSQSQLCELANIGSSTASTIVSRLREKGYITETRGTSANRGPKPTILKLNPECRYLFGVEINPSYIFVGLFNFVGRLQDKIRIALGSDHSVQHVIDLLTVNLPGLLNRNHLNPSAIIGVGVTLSGSVLPNGWISLSSPMGWKNVSLTKELKRFFDFPTFVYSNRVRLLAEFELTPALESKNILYLNIADGVGSTVYMNGKLVYGATGRYGEIGHIVVEPDGPVCGCGNRGCLEAFISGPSLVAKIQRDLPDQPDICFAGHFKDNQAVKAPEEIFAQWSDYIAQNDPYAVHLRDFVANHFAKVAAVAINCYDPDVVILGGYVSSHLHASLAEAIGDSIDRTVYESSLRNIEIIPARAGKDALITGVANAVLQDVVSF